MLHSRLLKYLDEVARLGSIRKASARLNVASSAINRQILALENELGTPIFERMPRRLRLTATGEVLESRPMERGTVWTAVERLRALAIRAFEAVDGSGLGRCDFFFTPDGRWVVNEINTMPGFTPISMYPAMWERTGLSYDDLISELLDLALERGVGLH